MGDNLFPIFGTKRKSAEDPKMCEGSPNELSIIPNWLNIGSSFKKKPKKSKHSHKQKEKEKPKTLEKSDNKLKHENRVKATDFFDSSESESEIEKIESNSIKEYNKNRSISMKSRKEEKREKHKIRTINKQREMIKDILREQGFNEELIKKREEVIKNKLSLINSNNNKEEGIIEIGELIKYESKELERILHRDEYLSKLEINNLKGFPSVYINCIPNPEYYAYGALPISSVPQFTRISRETIIGINDKYLCRILIRQMNEYLGIYSKYSGKVRDSSALGKTRYFHKNNYNTADFGVYTDRNKGILSGMTEAQLFQLDAIPFDSQEAGNQIIKGGADPAGDFVFELDELQEQEKLYIMAKKRLNEEIRKEPGNIRYWLNYLKFEDQNAVTTYAKQVYL